MLCTVGDLVEDVVVWLSDAPGVGTDTDARVFHRRGGSAANVAALCVANGTPARFAGRIGADALGDTLARELAACGVDVRVERAGRTGTIVVLVSPGGERTMLTDRGSAIDFAGDDQTLLDRVSVLHLPAYSLTVGPLAESARRLATEARRRGIPVSVDASSIATVAAFGAQRFLALLTSLEPDVLLMNGDEAHQLGVATQAPIGVRLAVVHRGAGPAIALRGDQVVASVEPPRVVEAADTTGAGDAFAAGFLPTWHATTNVEAALAEGHACAARTLSAPGAAIASAP